MFLSSFEDMMMQIVGSKCDFDLVSTTCSGRPHPRRPPRLPPGVQPAQPASRGALLRQRGGGGGGGRGARGRLRDGREGGAEDEDVGTKSFVQQNAAYICLCAGGTQSYVVGKGGIPIGRLSL